jgi:hypothetical protein
MALAFGMHRVVATLLAVSVTQPAFAQDLFGTAPLDNGALEAIRGTSGPSYFTLTVAQHAAIQDELARNDVRFIVGLGGTVMTHWWATEGAELIAASAAAGR